MVFDFDGTLTELILDFQCLKAEVVRIAMEYVPESTVAALKDRFIIEMIYEIEDRLDGRGTAFRVEAFDRLRRLEVEALRGKEVYPYTRDVLTRLRRKGLKVGVVTRNCFEAIKSVFPDIAKFVDATVTRDDLREVKPDPRHVYAVSRLLAIIPGRGDDGRGPPHGYRGRKGRGDENRRPSYRQDDKTGV